MAIFQLAQWRGPVPNKNAGAIVRPLQGLVLHIQQGTEIGTDATFQNPASKVSAHFGNPKSGKLDQWVDTNDVAWAQVAGNSTWISVENEGNSGDALTASQLANMSVLFAWLNLLEHTPLQLANAPTDSGLGYHGMGGAAWGNHPNCPGQPIVDQRATIIGAAQQLIAVPVISSISPTSGNAGTTVTITGSGFTFTTDVGFGNVSAAQMSVDSDTQITVVAPDGSATVDITVTTLVGTSATCSNDQFTFADASASSTSNNSTAPPSTASDSGAAPEAATPAAPAVTAINPASGPAGGGSSVVISGSGFTSATSVTFGSTPASGLSVDNDGQVTATAPAGTGSVDVIVVTSLGSSPAVSAGQFTYIAPPAVIGIDPASGPVAGGTQVVLAGSGFTGVTSVGFGATSVSQLSIDSDVQITVTTPAGSGVVDVVVTSPQGSSPTTPADQFTYV